MPINKLPIGTSESRKFNTLQKGRFRIIFPSCNLIIKCHLSSVEIDGFSLDVLDPKILFGTRPEILTDLQMAREAREHAYAPHSKFAVGACICTHDNVRHVGWNIENAMYEVTHAEVAAISKMLPISRRAGIERIAVVAGPIGINSRKAYAPCGFCRQALYEFTRNHDDPDVIIAAVRGRIYQTSLKRLLPLAFQL